MRIWLDLPDAAVELLTGPDRDITRAALEALAIDAYRRQRLTSQELRDLLGIPSRDALDGFLKRHGVPLEYDIEDFEREGVTSALLWRKRQEERAAESSPDSSVE